MKRRTKTLDEVIMDFVRVQQRLAKSGVGIALRIESFPIPPHTKPEPPDVSVTTERRAAKRERRK